MIDPIQQALATIREALSGDGPTSRYYKQQIGWEEFACGQDESRAALALIEQELEGLKREHDELLDQARFDYRIINGMKIRAKENEARIEALERVVREDEKDAALLGAMLQYQESPQGSLVGAILKRTRAVLAREEDAPE
jgi:hypothetical protein